MAETKIAGYIRRNGRSRQRIYMQKAAAAAMIGNRFRQTPRFGYHGSVLCLLSVFELPKPSYPRRRNTGTWKQRVINWSVCEIIESQKSNHSFDAKMAFEIVNLSIVPGTIKRSNFEQRSLDDIASNEVVVLCPLWSCTSVTYSRPSQPPLRPQLPLLSFSGLL